MKSRLPSRGVMLRLSSHVNATLLPRRLKGSLCFCRHLFDVRNVFSGGIKEVILGYVGLSQICSFVWTRVCLGKLGKGCGSCRRDVVLIIKISFLLAVLGLWGKLSCFTRVCTALCIVKVRHTQGTTNRLGVFSTEGVGTRWV